MYMTRDQARALLPSICSRVENDGFYAAFEVFSYHSLASGSYPAKDIISQHIKSNSIDIVDPNGVHTLLYRFDAGLYKAYPIVSMQDFLRFFRGSWRNNVCGIALVSHKLKSLSFLYACYDVDDTDSNVSLFAVGDKSTKWAWHLQIANDENHQWPLEFVPNKLHTNYTKMFSYRGLNSIGAFTSICFSIDDCIKDLFFYEKICSENEITGLNHSISSANWIIDSQRTKIQEFNTKIDNIRSDLEKYKVGLYASRVDADLNN